jgi:small-conductance mechanosensitive channel
VLWSDFDMLIQFIRSIWFAGLLGLALWTIVMLVMKGLLLRWLRRSAYHRHWVDSFVGVVSPVLNILIVVGGIAIVTGFMPLPAKWQNMVSMVLQAGMVLVLAVCTDRLVMTWMRREATRFTLLGEGYSLITGALRGLVVGIGALMLLQSVGISIGPLLASLGIGSLAIALSLQDTLKNMFSGLFVVADKPLEVGDFVKLETGQEGYLSKLGWRSSKFRMPNDGFVVVPNSKLVDSVVTNYRASDGGIALCLDLSVQGLTELERVEQVTGEVARAVMRSVAGGVPHFDPFFRFHTISGGAVSFTVSLRARSGAAIDLIRHEFIKRVTERYQRENIKFS